MALLNYTSRLSLDLKNKIVGTAVSDKESYKLYFTGDGHIITHKLDYTALFTESTTTRGLVPTVNKSILNTELLLKKAFLNAKGEWGLLTTDQLPIWIKSSADTLNKAKLLYTAETVDQMIQQGFSANDAMRFKGIITYKGIESYEATGYPTSFPTKCEIGDTYRVTAPGTYAGLICSSGDLMICIKNGSSTNGSLNSKDYWTVVESNINGTVTHIINGLKYTFYSNDNLGSGEAQVNPINIYAPLTKGTVGQILVSDGSAIPKWQSNSINNITDIGSLFTNLTWVSGGKLSMTIGGTEKSVTPSGTWGISISGSANRVANNLTVLGPLSLKNSLSQLTTTYNGSTALTLQVATASTTGLGVVSVDPGKVEGGEAKPTLTINKGVLSLTRDNVINALGYTPGTANPESFIQRPIKVNNVEILGTKNTDPLDLTAGTGVTLSNAKGIVTISAIKSWRPIYINNESIGDKTLKIMPSADIWIGKDITSTDEYEISLGLSWYNVDTEKYEIPQ